MSKKIVLFSSLMILVLFLSACGAGSTGETTRTISVSGTGTVYLEPDIAYLYVGVHVEDADITAAVDRNNQRTQSLMDTLVSQGVDTEDIQTSNFSIWSMEAWDDTGKAYTKYSVDNTVYITVRNLEQLCDLLNAVVSAGANNISSISFDVADKTGALSEARQLAMDNAKTLAEELAGVAGVVVGEVQNIAYTEYYPSPYYGMGMGGGGAAMEAAAVPIQPGKMQVSVTVNVIYGIK